MATTITLTNDLEAQLQQQAQAQHRPAEEVALDLLRQALAEAPAVATTSDEVSEVVAKIRATAPDFGAVRPASGSLAEALRRTLSRGEGQGFDLQAWKREWGAAEAEALAVERADDQAEGRG